MVTSTGRLGERIIIEMVEMEEILDPCLVETMMHVGNIIKANVLLEVGANTITNVHIVVNLDILCSHVGN